MRNTVDVADRAHRFRMEALAHDIDVLEAI
jgi:hypothetical protein